MSAAALAAGVAPAAERIDGRKLVAFVAMVFGMFMALLDIQIVSASLAEIQAGLAASSDEISWVQTSYLIAEVVMIPLSGFLARGLSTRVLFTASAAGFTAMSLVCGLQSSIGGMIAARALQGFVGGAMIPSVFAAAYTVFPPSKRGVVTPLVGLIATLAPTVGPTIGGYLTDLFSWHWLFFVNVLPGIAVSLAAWTLIDFDEPESGLLSRFDWTGLACMALFLCSMEYVLEEGPSKDWFDDRSIALFAVLAAVGCALFFARTLTARTPIVDLGAFRDANFATGCLFSFVLGIGLYGLTYLFPLYLGRSRGYSALQIGETMFVSGACMFVAAPIVGKLLGKVDPRRILAVGLVGFCSGTWLMTGIGKDWDFGELLLPQILRGFSLMACMLPINNVALGTLPPAQVKNASGLYNLMRNLGGAFGLAGINTVLNHRLDLHLARLHDHVNPANPEALARLAALTRRFATLADPGGAALKALANQVRGQAYVMALGDVFLVITIIFALMLPMLAFMRRPAPAKGGGGAH